LARIVALCANSRRARASGRAQSSDAAQAGTLVRVETISVRTAAGPPQFDETKTASKRRFSAFADLASAAP